MMGKGVWDSDSAILRSRASGSISGWWVTMATYSPGRKALKKKAAYFSQRRKVP